MNELGYIKDGVEFINTTLLDKIDRMTKQYLNFGIGVYSDKLFEELYGRPSIKPYKERSRLANSIKGVDFVFEVKEIEGDIQKEPPLYMDDGTPKLFHVAFAPGTYDLLHEGHLEHLLIARKLSDILVVGVKSDTHVWETKSKKPFQNETTRMTVIKNLNIVDYVILVPTRDKRWANKTIYEFVGSPIDVVILGSDCKGQEHIYNPDNLKFVFTDRNPAIQKVRSSSFYREELKKIT